MECGDLWSVEICVKICGVWRSEECGDLRSVEICGDEDLWSVEICGV